MVFRSGQTVRLHASLGGGAVRVVDRTEVHRDGRYVAHFGYRVENAGGQRFVISEEMLLPAEIAWRPGDVVVFRPAGAAGSTAYTYVRGRHGWPGDRCPARTDEQMNRWYTAGVLTPVLQSGGVPFDPARLPR